MHFGPIDTMPKRKRSGETDLQELLAKSQVAVQQALKEAKGHERQRLTKRLRDARTTPDKKERLDREVLVLKVCSNLRLYAIDHL